MIIITQQPLDMTIRNSALILGLSMPCLEGFGKHQTTFIVLNTHNPLRSIEIAISLLGIKDCSILQVGHVDMNGGCRTSLEA